MASCCSGVGFISVSGKVANFPLEFDKFEGLCVPQGVLGRLLVCLRCLLGVDIIEKRSILKAI